MKADAREHPIDPAWEDDPACPECDGEGGYHDCMEDCCACLDPYNQDWWMCEHCGGTGSAYSENPDES